MNKTEDLKATRTIVFVSFPKASATFSTIQSLSFPPSANRFQGANCVVYLEARYEDRLPECR